MRQFSYPATSRGHIIRCLAAFVFTALAVFPFLENNATQSDHRVWQVNFAWISLSLAYGLATCVLCTAAVRSPDRSWRRYPLIVFFLAVAASRALGVPGFRNFARYGDSLSSFLTDNEDMGRWLLGFAVTRETFDGINSLFFAFGSLPFVRLSGSLLMVTCGCWVVSKRENHITPWLVVLSPTWVLFSVGHDEYYPFIAGLIFVLSWQILSSQRFFDQNTNYLLSGVLPALYIGAVPLSVALLVFSWGAEHEFHRRIRGAVIAIVSFAVAIEVGGEFKGYFKNLKSDLNINGFIRSSEGSLEDSPIAVTQSGSFLASWSYAITRMHFLDILFWLVCGAGLIVLILVTADSWSTQRMGQPVPLPNLVKISGLNRAARVTLVLSAAVFLIFMLPQLGPTADIDLYFWSLFVILLLVGSRLDRDISSHEDPQRRKTQLIQILAIGFSPATIALVVFGVSRY